MPLPKTLRIGGFDWAIVIDGDVAREGNNFGSMHGITQKIFLDEQNTAQKMRQCLLHEILHVLMWQSGLDKRLDNKNSVTTDEEIIVALSFGLYQVLNDNPGLLGIFSEKEQP